MHPQYTTRRPTIPANCAHCGKPFQARRDRALLRPVYCSRTCSNQAHVRPLVERFGERVDKSGDCWIWIGNIHVHGYGVIIDNHKTLLAHRVSWELHNGPIPDGMSVCHSCDRNYPVGNTSYRRCVNPSHLFLGTFADNMVDMVTKGRQAKGERVIAFAHLAEEQAKEIKQRYGTGESYESLAARYGLHIRTVHRLVQGKTWRHI